MKMLIEIDKSIYMGLKHKEKISITDMCKACTAIMKGTIIVVEPKKSKAKSDYEAIQGYISIDDVMSVFDDYMRGEVDEDDADIFLEMLKDKALEQDPKWIPVTKEFPDKEGYYLCSVRYMYPPYNFFDPEKVKYMDDVTIQKFDGEFNIEVKAWMPLPPCYKPHESEVKE